MLSLTIGQISTGSVLSTTDYLEAEVSGVSKKIDIQTLANYMTPLGSYVDMAYEKTPSATFPAVAVYDADHTISETNYPLLVPELRAAYASVTLTAGTIVSTINVNATGGSILSSVDSAYTIMLSALTEEYAVQSAYSICVTIGGVDYTITSVSTVIGISGSIATGATTMTIYPHRIVGTTASAIVFKDSGRALMSHDGKLRVAGMRRRHHFQGHYHNPISPTLGFIGTGGSTHAAAGASYAQASTTGAPVTDTVNGTPITGPESEPNSASVYRYIWAQRYTP
jgi:hypothetical protein